MAQPLSVKLERKVQEEAERIVRRSGVTRNAYINRAVRFYNRMHRRRSLKDELAKESRRIAASSREVLEEFERFIDEGL